MTPYAALELAIHDWAAHQADIAAVLVVGSRARNQPPPDEWSDLDLVVFSEDPARHTRDAAWLAALGDCWLTMLDRTGRGDPEWYALFAGGLKADLVFVAAAPGADLNRLLADSPYRAVYWRGLRVLYHRGPAPAPLALPAPRPVPRPSAAEFEQHVLATLLIANKAARLLCRGDRWRARHQADCLLQQQLLTMLEWHAWARGGATAPDTWYGGRYLDQWADPDAVAELPTLFAAGDPPSAWRALLASLALYRRLAQAVATAWSLRYPAAADAHVSAWLAGLRPTP
jgi:aminoglycoside 6-adenylyltransferase